MFLENQDSEKVAYLLTTKGKIKFLPGQFKEVDRQDILTAIPSALIEITEEVFYDHFKQPSPQTTNEEQNDKDDTQDNDNQTNEPTNENEGQTNNEQGNEVPLTKEQLEAKLEELKNIWVTTSKPRKKEQIQKQIKELQAQIEKL